MYHEEGGGMIYRTGKRTLTLTLTCTHKQLGRREYKNVACAAVNLVFDLKKEEEEMLGKQ